MQVHDQVLFEYLSECDEMLDKLGLLLGRLEREGYDREILRTIARDVHTIKGSSQLFGFKLIGQVAHAMEDSLQKLQDAAPVNLPTLIDHLYGAVDVIAQLFSSVKTTKAEPPIGDEVKAIVARLETLASTVVLAPPPDVAVGAVTPVAEVLKAADGTVPSPSAALAKAKAAVAAAVGRIQPAAPPVAAAPVVHAPVAVAKAPGRAEAEPAVAAKASGEDAQSDTVRVSVDLLDNLMNLVGELVLIRNQLHEATRTSVDDALVKVSQRLNVVSGELQADIMKTRMQPIGNVLTKFHRVVRDTARDLGKRIELEITGTETELDKTLIEAVRDPLMHLIRNAVDHGLELPADRKAAGKSETGRIHVRAFHESGQVVVEIRDDGRGLHRDKIAAKAVERGLMTPEQAAKLSDREVYQFIFLPGFSTASQVSNLSGRGVGMDVVKTNIERIGGAVELSSQPGRGATVTLKLPLTLAIISALIVRCGSDRFAIPQVKLLELLCVPGEGDKGGLERLQGRLVYRLRGQLLPLVDLAEILQLRQVSKASSENMHSIAVVTADRQTFGLLVDTIEDSADIVVKPVASFLKDIGAFSGATVLGDGEVALTLDVGGLATKAGLIDDGATPLGGEEHGKTSTRHLGDATEYLMVDVAGKGKYAIPLCLVSRLEEFALTDLHYAGDQRVVRYRDTLLPLLSVPKALGLRPDDIAANTEKMAVVVIKHAGHFYGLLVDRIVDVMVSAAPIDANVRDRDGILGAMIEGQEVIVVIDATGLIDEARKVLGGGSEPEQDTTEPLQLRSERGRHKVLLAEDGPFFRKHVARLLEGAGYSVIAEVDGERALAVLDKMAAGTFTMIVSDIEMPMMTGLELARQVRSRPACQTLPMLALSSRFSEQDIQVGLDAGFTSYLEKLRPGELVAEVDRLLGLNTGGRHAA